MRRAPWSLGGFVVALLLAGCPSIRIQGIVSDARTGTPIPGCEVFVAKKSTRTDAEGRYVLKVRPWKGTVDFHAEGYLPRAVTFTRVDRYPHVNAALQPVDAEGGGARFDPYTGERMTPRFDPYTGKPLRSQP